jgi:hypothetical protein
MKIMVEPGIHRVNSAKNFKSKGYSPLTVIGSSFETVKVEISNWWEGNYLWR